MNEKFLSTLRHILTVIGVVLGLVGLSKYTDVVNYIQDNLEAVNGAVLALIGFATTLYGFFFKRPAEWRK